MIRRIQKRLIEFIKTDAFFISLLSLIFLVYSFSFLSQFLKDSELLSVGGWDGANHFAIAKVYAEEMFPRLFGWTFSWNAGMVFPLGYPPASYFFLGFLAWLLPFKFVFIFKFLVIFSIIFLVITAYFLPKKFGLNKLESFFSALIFLFFLLSPFSFSTGGLSFLASFRSGLYSQLFAGPLLVLWLFSFVDAFKSKKNFFWSVILLFLILITNIHIGEAALIIWLAFLIGDYFLFKKYNVIKIYFWHFLLSFLLLSVWSLPLLINLDYFLNFTFQPSHFLSFFRFPVFIFLSFALLGWVFSILNKKRIYFNLGFSGLLLMLTAFLPVNLVFKSLPLQPQRLLPIIIIVLAPLAVFGLKFFHTYLNKYVKIQILL